MLFLHLHIILLTFHLHNWNILKMFIYFSWVMTKKLMYRHKIDERWLLVSLLKNTATWIKWIRISRTGTLRLSNSLKSVQWLTVSFEASRKQTYTGLLLLMQYSIIFLRLIYNDIECPFLNPNLLSVVSRYGVNISSRIISKKFEAIVTNDKRYMFVKYNTSCWVTDMASIH